MEIGSLSVSQSLWKCLGCHAWNDSIETICIHCLLPAQSTYKCYVCSSDILKVGDEQCFSCGVILDDTAWDLVFEHNGLSSRSKSVNSASILDDTYCMRCGDSVGECTCDVMITEQVFCDFSEQYEDNDYNIYEDSWSFAQVTCWDCDRQSTASCPRLLDLIHDILSNPGANLLDFPKISICEDFIQIT